jgi:hypothetical protein
MNSSQITIASMMAMTLAVGFAEILPANAAGNCGANSNTPAPVVRAFRLPDTPYLAPYPGRVSSAHATAKPYQHKVCYNVSFTTAEKPAQVLAWYRSAFKTFGWTIESDSPSGSAIDAHRDDDEVSTTILANNNGPTGTQVEISYWFVRKSSVQ